MPLLLRRLGRSINEKVSSFGIGSRRFGCGGPGFDAYSDQQPGFVRVQPGDPDASYLINKLTGVGITGDRMPADGLFLSPAEIQVFRLWIEQDASDN